jgi:WD40 repeat protein
MREAQDNLQPETIDHVIECVLEDGWLPQQDRQTTRLIQQLQSGSQAYAQENERSLDSIWQRLAQSQERSVFLPAQWKQQERKIITMKEKVSMDDNNVSWGMNPPIPISQAKKRRSLLRMVGLSLIAAVAIITILSFTVFSGILRPASQTASSKSQTTVTGAHGRQQQPMQPVITNAKLACSIGLDIRALPPFDYSITRAVWSAQGKIAVTSTEDLTTFSAKDCSGKSTKLGAIYEAVWSPDGTKLVTADSSAYALNVMDSNGNTIANIPFTHLGATFVGNLVWSSDSRKLIFISDDPNHQASIKSVDANGSNLKTLMQINTNGGTSGALLLSPDGKYVLISQLNKAAMRKELSIWDINTGKKVSDIPSDGTTAFSPDGSLLAVGGTNQVQIYSTVDGKFQSSFTDPDAGTGAKDLAGLAWSPDGKFIAESATSINIYDVTAKKIVTTFGKVDAHHKIFSVAWGPDDGSLVSSSDLLPDDNHSQTFVNVWTLS